MAASNPAEVLLNRSAQRWKWEVEWLASSDSADRLDFLRGHRELRVKYFEGNRVSGFCVNELGICEGYAAGESGEFLGSTNFKPGSLADSDLEQLAGQCLQRLIDRERLSRTATGPTGATGLSFDPQHLPANGVPSAPNRISQTWAQVAFQIVPIREPTIAAVSALKDAALREASKMRRGCSEGEVLAPRFGVEDPWVLVYVDLGIPCEQGVMFFSRLADGTWAKQLFDIEPSEVQAIRKRIQSALLFTERLTRQ
jgi:hypothetical protein